jgi:hypothetical protein
VFVCICLEFCVLVLEHYWSMGIPGMKNFVLYEVRLIEDLFVLVAST